MSDIFFLFPDYENTEDIALSEFNTDVLNEIYELCEQNSAEFILMLAPYDTNSSELSKRIKAEIKWADDKGVKVLDYCAMLEELEIDPSHDYFDAGHLDISGARKVSRHFAAYLSELGCEKNELVDNEKWEADYNVYVKSFPEEFE